MNTEKPREYVVWDCKIGMEKSSDLTAFSDFRMRQAVSSAFTDLTGQSPEFNFSGWGAELDEAQRAVVECRLPDKYKLDPWTPSEKDYCRSIHHNPNAGAWADLFVQTYPGLVDKHEIMVSWFANAMMAMYDYHQNKLHEKQSVNSQPMPILEFSNPMFHAGTNLTVRRGRKWCGRSFATIIVNGCEINVPITTRTVVFKELTDDMLSYEHDPKCRTVEGLFMEMCRVYKGFKLNEEVTLVSFKLPVYQEKRKAEKPVVRIY